MKQTVAVIIGLTLFSVIANTPHADAAENDAAVRKAVEDSNAKWMAALKKRDAAGIAARYTEDARLLPPGSLEVQGRAAIQAFFQLGIDAGLVDVTLTTVEVTMHGDAAIERGTYKSVLKLSADTETSDQGKYLVVWKQESGAWKMAVDIWNSDAPTM